MKINRVVFAFTLFLGLSLCANVLGRVFLTANEQKQIEALEMRLENNITRKEKGRIVKEIQKYKRAKELKELAIRQIEENLKDKRFSKLKPLLSSGDIDSAIKDLEKIKDVSLGKKLSLKAELLKLIGKIEDADDAYYEASSKSLDIKYEYALFLQNQKKFYDAIDIYKELLQEYKKSGNLEREAVVLNNLANINYRIKKYKEAGELFEKSLKIKEELAKKDAKYEPTLAKTLSNMTLFYSDIRKKDIAKQYYFKYRDLYKKFYQKEPKRFSFEYARALIVGFVLFKFETSVLDKANEIIKRYPREDIVNSVTKTIKRLKSRRSGILVN